MRKLIIGCGYLGSRVAKRWRENADDVFALTRSVETAERFRANGWTPVIGDVTKKDSLGALPEVDQILYAVGFDRSSGLSQREIYVGGLKNVLDRIGDRVSRFLYISSTSVYGQSQGEWIDEASPAIPATESGQICREAEMLIEKMLPQSGTILRLAGIYGPGRLLRRISDLKAATPIAGDPEGWLNLIHVDDAVATILACEKQSEPERLYLVSDDWPVRRREYYSLLADLLGCPLLAFDPESQPRHVAGLGKRCSNRKIRQDLRVELSFPMIYLGLPSSIGADSAD